MRRRRATNIGPARTLALLSATAVLWCLSLSTSEAVRLPDSDYSPWNAARSLLYSQAAYCTDVKASSSSSVESWGCSPCLTLPDEMKLMTPVAVHKCGSSIPLFGTGVKVFAGLAVDGTLVISYRGTDNIANIVADLGFTQATFSGDAGFGKQKAHKGFLKAFTECSPWVSATISEASLTATRIIITGHSLGGAVANLYIAGLADAAAKGQLPAGHFMNRPEAQVHVYTFGQPRTGNDALAATLNDRIDNKVAASVGIWRVVNGRDPVPRLPKKVAMVFWRYHHVLKEVWFPRTLLPDSPKICSGGGGEDHSCMLSEAGVSITRHFLDDYQDRLYGEYVAAFAARQGYVNPLALSTQGAAVPGLGACKFCSDKSCYAKNATFVSLAHKASLDISNYLVDDPVAMNATLAAEVPAMDTLNLAGGDVGGKIGTEAPPSGCRC